jgi:hypothetical protein
MMVSLVIRFVRVSELVSKERPYPLLAQLEGGKRLKIVTVTVRICEGGLSYASVPELAAGGELRTHWLSPMWVRIPPDVL